MAGKGYVLGLRRLGGEQQGFTLVEIIAVLVLLGILAAVVAPKYMDLTDTARQKVAVGQLYEVKVRLKDGLQGYKLANNGSLPPDAATLLAYVNGQLPGACPTTPTTEGDFEFSCSTSGLVITIAVSKVQGVKITSGNTDTYTVQ